MTRSELLNELDRIIDVGIVNAHHDTDVLKEIKEELQKPVLLITAGSYSDYHVEGVSFDMKTAERMSKLVYDSNDIEVFVPVEFEEGCEINFDNETYLHVEWDPEKNKITSTKIEMWQNTPNMNFYGKFSFSVSVRSRVARDALEHGKDSDLLKKVAQDRYAAWKEKDMELHPERYTVFSGKFVVTPGAILPAKEE